jgi:ribosomal protein S3AE
MRALTTMGIGYAITRVPKKIYPFRPVEIVQTTHSIGGKRKTKRKAESSDEEEFDLADILPPKNTPTDIYSVLTRMM